ncbi:MAG: A/G-specific adenine glycosylase [Anaerolineales bacterium]
MKSQIANELLRWYGKHRRSLPWRHRPSPYSVWVAEVMAQQTRLDTMLTYYRQWMRKFPTIAGLSTAREQDVLAMWEGLGYYSRARNLHKAAKIIVSNLDGQLPSEVEQLRELPGIGRYTAGMIASLAFNRDEPAVDGNAIRVLARVFNVEAPPISAAGREQIWQLAARHLPPRRAAQYNQALMDLGSDVCTPRTPNCVECPLKSHCQAYELGIQEKRPVKAKAPRIAQRNFAAAVIRKERNVLLRQRPPDGLLGGMWEFPNIQISNQRAKSKLTRALQDALGATFSFNRKGHEYQHTYSHFHAHLAVYSSDLNGASKLGRVKFPYRWVSISKLHELPMGKLDRRIANDLNTKSWAGKR